MGFDQIKEAGRGRYDYQLIHSIKATLKIKIIEVNVHIQVEGCHSCLLNLNVRYEHVVINSPFFHLHVHTLGQMVLKALEVMKKMTITKKSISCNLTILPFLFLLVFS